MSASEGNFHCDRDGTHVLSQPTGIDEAFLRSAGKDQINLIAQSVRALLRRRRAYSTAIKPHLAMHATYPCDETER
jgi:hypothetical protein